MVRSWSATYDLVVRLTPDVDIRADGVRSTSDAFRDEIEGILDERLPGLVSADQLVSQPASDITEAHDWWPLAERLAARLGEPLLAPGVTRPTSRQRSGRPRGKRSAVRADDQLALDLGR